jgi:ferredoxin-type protein NapG
MDRATFIRVALGKAKDTAAQGAARTIDRVADRLAGDLLRPPGALREADFLLACTRCGECASACPHFAIRPAGADAGAAVDTPHILPELAACYLCEDLPCVKACGDGALVPPVGGWAGVRLGTAQLHESRCLVSNGEACDICVQCCPYPELAIRLDDETGLPVVNPDACAGCGVCVQVCPVRPAALSVRPFRASEFVP